MLGVMSRADEFFGANDMERMFPGGSPLASAPWPTMGRRRDVKDYDPEIVRAALLHPDRTEIVHVDPRNFRSTQPSVTRAGVAHYMTDEYERTGRTFADQHNAGNKFPLAYDREDGQRLLLSGHHRGTAALLQGKQFPVRLLQGPWGPPRR